MAEKSIGGLWLNTSKAGKKYMSGQIEIEGVKHKIIVFKNDRKEKDTQPDYTIYASKPKEEKQSSWDVEGHGQTKDESQDLPF